MYQNCDNWEEMRSTEHIKKKELSQGDSDDKPIDGQMVEILYKLQNQAHDDIID